MYIMMPLFDKMIAHPDTLSQHLADQSYLRVGKGDILQPFFMTLVSEDPKWNPVLMCLVPTDHRLRYKVWSLLE